MYASACTELLSVCHLVSPFLSAHHTLCVSDDRRPSTAFVLLAVGFVGENDPHCPPIAQQGWSLPPKLSLQAQPWLHPLNAAYKAIATLVAHFPGTFSEPS